MEALTNEHMDDLKQIFDFFDKDGSGYISATELSKMTKVCGGNISKWEVQDLIAEIDTGGKDGRLDFHEYVNMMLRQLARDQATKDAEFDRELKEAFAFLDKDGDMSLSVQDLDTAFKSIGIEYSQEMLREMIREVDSKNRSGIKWKDFCQAMGPAV